MTLSEFEKEALTLAEGDRAHLAHLLLSSLTAHGAPDALSEEWDAELRSRVDRIRSGQAESSDAYSVIAELREKYRA